MNLARSAKVNERAPTATRITHSVPKYTRVSLHIAARSADRSGISASGFLTPSLARGGPSLLEPASVLESGRFTFVAKKHT